MTPSQSLLRTFCVLSAIALFGCPDEEGSPTDPGTTDVTGADAGSDVSTDAVNDSDALADASSDTGRPDTSDAGGGEDTEVDARPDALLDDAGDTAVEDVAPDAEPDVDEAMTDARLLAAFPMRQVVSGRTQRGVGLVFGGVTPEERETATLEGSIALLDSDEVVSLTGAQFVGVQRVASGPAWSRQISGEPVLTLRGPATPIELTGVVQEDGSILFAPELARDGQPAMAPITIVRSPGAVAAWSADGLVAMEGEPVGASLSFRIASGLSESGAPMTGFGELTTWELSVPELPPCASREGCPDAVPRATTYRGEISEDVMSIAQMAVPAEFTLQDDERVSIDISFGPEGAESPLLFGGVLGLNNTKKDPPPPLTAALERPPAPPFSGVASESLAGELFLAAVPGEDTDDGSAVPSTHVLVFAAPIWNAVDATPQEEEDGRQAVLNFGTTLDSADEFWPSVTAHSFQVVSDTVVTFEADPDGFSYVAAMFVVESRSPMGSLELQAGDDVPGCFRYSDEPVGFCGLLYQDGRQWRLSLTAFAADANDLPRGLRTSLTALPGRGVPASTWEPQVINFNPGPAAVFGIEVAFASAPDGVPFLADVQLEYPADGELAAISIGGGRYDGAFIMGETSAQLLSGPAIESDVERGDILIGGEPIGIEREVGGDPVPVTPPAVVLLTSANGVGTRNVATANTAKPGLL